MLEELARREAVVLQRIEEIREQIAALESRLEAEQDRLSARAASLTHDQLEETIAEQGRELLRQLLQAHLDLRAWREQQAVLAARRDGAGLAAPDGVVRRRVEMGHHRLLATVVGTVTVTRCAWRTPAVRNVYPADAALSLPAVRHSAGLAKLAVVETVRGSFDTAYAAISARCGQVIGKRQIEHLVAQVLPDTRCVHDGATRDGHVDSGISGSGRRCAREPVDTLSP
ncbi:hypothetical protein AB0L53_56510 [Nonomuraea sp. NPDC052129]|uniref:hypothetical protein n=1 Tax=Nonomuraea sp. NPDC052129 TaxID=3154651 RepID=UPI00343EEB4B